MTLKVLEKRIQVLEDIEAIKKLKHSYCAYCDDNYDADGIANLFVEDGVWDGDIRGRYEGQEAIRAFFKQASQRLPFAIHQVLNPIIEVNGDTAHGTWYLFQACTQKEGAIWVAGVYEDDYVKVNGQWKYKKLTVTFKFWTPFDQGWAKQQFV